MDLDENREDRFSRDAAHIYIPVNVSCPYHSTRPLYVAHLSLVMSRTHSEQLQNPENNIIKSSCI